MQPSFCVVRQVRPTGDKRPGDLQTVDQASKDISDSNIKNGRFLNHVMAWKQVNLIFKRIYKYVTCDQALFSFRSVKHSGGTGETKNRA